MDDQNTTIKEVKEVIKAFIQERDWQQFHSPKNLSMDLSIEANELMEKFLWMDSKDSFKELETNRQEIEDEAADTLFALLAFCNTANIDIAKAFAHKIEEIGRKYPVEKSKGKATKYNKL